MGEKIATNPVTDTGSMTVPIVRSPGRSGPAPRLSLSCDFGASNGPFGFPTRRVTGRSCGGMDVP